MKKLLSWVLKKLSIHFGAVAAVFAEDAAEDAAEVPLCFKCADTRVADTVCARVSAAAQSAVAGSVAAHARRPWPWRSPAGARRSFRG